MLTALAQSTPTATESVASVASIIAATFLLVAIAKALVPKLAGRATLIVSLLVAVGLTLIALFVTRTLVGDPVAYLLAVLSAIAGAAGIDATGSAVLKGPKSKALKLLAPVGLVLLLSGCSTMSPSQRYAVTSNAFSATVQEVAVLVEIGVIPDGQIDAIKATADEIDIELDALDAAVRNSIPLDYRFALARVERLLGRLVQYQLDHEGLSHAYRPCIDHRLGICGDPLVRRDSGDCPGSQERWPATDGRGIGPGEVTAEAGDAAAGRRDRLASQLDAAGYRLASMTAEH